MLQQAHDAESRQLVGLDDAKAAIAAELAVGLLPPESIIERFSLSKQQFRSLLNDSAFRAMVAQIRAEWEEASNAKERIRLKAALAVEDGLLELHRIFYNVDLNPASRIDAFKQLVALSDTAPRKEGGTAEGTKFQLTINLKGEPKGIVIEGDPGGDDDQDL